MKAAEHFDIKIASILLAQDCLRKQIGKKVLNSNLMNYFLQHQHSDDP